jgi:hypothetical protein
MGGCAQETVVLLIRSVHAFSPNWIFHSWESGAVFLEIHPTRLRLDTASHRGVPMRQKWYGSDIDLVNDSFGLAQISDAAKARSLVKRTAWSTPSTRHVPAGSGGNPGTT